MPPIFMQYIGRFAPSPSGRLHFGSLVCALGSFLKARHVNGKYLLRIEDLDYYRCNSGLTKVIIDELHALGFEYDEPPYIQSEHVSVYKEIAQELIKNKDAFYCDCSRSFLKANPCNCRQENLLPSNDLHLSLRYSISKDHQPFFYDELLGTVQSKISDNFITLIRADKVISYNLACVTDDILQGITQVVRGSDLIDITTSQMCLYKSLNKEYISYLHLPLAMQDDKFKLSKQNHAKAVMDIDTPQNLLLKALNFLGQNTTDLNKEMKVEKILSLAVDRFELNLIPKEPKLSPIL